ncbi:MAG: PEP-CTERM sorting domain-containing protein [Betaproteobacteria bacterium]|nr:PEP-CTERM sorting domain-containing protein [Betaproteobacteria bacterium]
MKRQSPQRCPEPGALALLGLGLAIGRRRKRRADDGSI